MGNLIRKIQHNYHQMPQLAARNFAIRMGIQGWDMMLERTGLRMDDRMNE